MRYERATTVAGSTSGAGTAPGRAFGTGPSSGEASGAGDGAGSNEASGAGLTTGVGSSDGAGDGTSAGTSEGEPVAPPDASGTATLCHPGRAGDDRARDPAREDRAVVAGQDPGLWLAHAPGVDVGALGAVGRASREGHPLPVGAVRGGGAHDDDTLDDGDRRRRGRCRAWPAGSWAAASRRPDRSRGWQVPARRADPTARESRLEEKSAPPTPPAIEQARWLPRETARVRAL